MKWWWLLLAACSAPKSAPLSPINSDADSGFSARLTDGGESAMMGSTAVAYQIDVSHSGHQIDPALAPPLSRKWFVDLSGPVSYPLISGGLVFVVANSQLVALDAANGNRVWTAMLASAWAALAMDEGKVFSADNSGRVAAYNAADGRPLWQKAIAGPSPPVAAGGMVFVSAGGRLYALGELDGAQQWNVAIDENGQGAPALIADGVFAACGCNAALRFAPATGFMSWHHSAACQNGSGGTPALANGRLYARDPSVTDAELDLNSGSVVANFIGDPIPAFNGTTGYFLSMARLQGIDQRSGSILFTFTGDSQLRSAPLAVNQAVYIGSGTGMVFAVDGTSGRVVWSANAGEPIAAPNESDRSQPLTGLAAGDGLLLVPAGHLLVAYQ